METSQNQKAIFSNRNEATKVTGEFYVTYSAERFGKKYTTTHLNPSGGIGCEISADELNEQWNKKYKGLCPFNGDANFEVIRIQQRTQF
jgi:hypothetical protein